MYNAVSLIEFLGYTKPPTIRASIKITQIGIMLVFFSPLGRSLILMKSSAKRRLSKLAY